MLRIMFAVLFMAFFGIGFGVVAREVTLGLSGEAALGWITFVGTIGFAIYSFRETKRREIEAQLFVQKAEIYTEIINIIRDVMFQMKGWVEPISEDEIGRRFAEARYALIVWGGEETIRAIGKLEDQNDPGALFAAAANLYKSIRKELGHHDDDKLSDELILAQVIASERNLLKEQMDQYRANSN